MAPTTGKKAFGEWLDVTLSNKQVQGRSLAERLGVHDSAVSRWRSGAAVPSMETVSMIAEILDVDPLRLAVTAGLVPVKVARVEPLDPPVPTERRESVKRQIARIRGLSEHSKRRLLEAYDDMIAEDGPE